MIHCFIRGIASLLLLGLVACSPSNENTSNGEESKNSANIQPISIGTGSLTGVYYPAGNAVCKTLSKGKEPDPSQCQALSTGGSTYNLENISSKKLQLGIAQADTTHRAWNGQAPFKERLTKLRVLFSMHEEMVTLVVHRDANITSFKRIFGKRINVGPEGSGNERVVAELLSACKIFPGDLAMIGREKTSKMPQALLSRTMDGYFYVVGHPNINVAQTATNMPLEILSLSGGCVDKLVQSQPYFDSTLIPGGLYRGVPEDVYTFGVKAWLVSSTDVSDATAYHVVKRIFENMDIFRKQHPTFYRLSPKKMLKKFSVPYHDGALKYYEEKGWFQDE